ncbi:MAG: polyprenol monophosphomannose synthase [Candidatus Marinimicrobia bacterium]|nr:polyprenol monophosphomannose synthase [Candidatus Neomarinimicrobiota bacterium]
MPQTVPTNKTLIITPTYNERQNVETLLERIHVVVPGAHVLVVDDNSPDGTGQWVEQQSEQEAWVHVLRRPEKQGLGTAYCAGFKWALQRDYQQIIQMDADLSHDPDQIPDLLAESKDYDLVIGSRYIKGVNIVNWPLSRLILSWSANLYARLITGIPVWDLTGGFKCWKRKVLEKLDIPTIRSEGYSFQIETTFRAYRQGYSIKEVPIIFIDRTEGDSKMSQGIIYEAVWMVIRLKLSQLVDITRKRFFQPQEAENPPEP